MKEKYETKNLLLKLRKKLTSLPDDLFEHDHFESLEIISENLKNIDSKIQNLKNLKTLSINAKALKSLPKEIFLIETLKILKIRNTQIDELHPDLNIKCKRLETFLLANNKIKSLPSWICHLEDLSTLDLSKNKLDTLPECFSNLKSLKRLNMDSNQIKDVPKALLNLKNINHISLDNNPLSDVAKNDLFKTFKIWF